MERNGPETILPRLAAGSTVTVGSFDGVHLGHQAVLREIAGRAAAAGRASARAKPDSKRGKKRIQRTNAMTRPKPVCLA